MTIGSPDSRRVSLFQQAVLERGWAAPLFVDFLDLLSGKTDLTSLLEKGDLVRIESPGRDFELEKALLKLGEKPLMELGSKPLTESEIDRLTFDKGLILGQRQWYQGWCQLLRLIKSQLSCCDEVSTFNDPDDIELLFDKIGCQALFARHEVPIPKTLGTICGFDHLQEVMRERRVNRVFLKPAHSSSASGIVAFQQSGTKYLAKTTVEMVCTDSSIKLYNSRAIRTYSDLNEIRLLVDQLARFNLFGQVWFPKAGLGRKCFDLRVLSIAGEAKHVVVRQSTGPFTNLHLLNGRGSVEPVIELIGERQYRLAIESAIKAARAFPNCLYVGVDLMIGADLRSHAIAEVNAFGDQLNGILCDGRTTYEAELDALFPTTANRPVGKQEPPPLSREMASYV